MKRILSIFIILSMVLALCACSDTSSKKVNEKEELIETTEEVVQFNFDNYEYKFKVEVDNIELSVPATFGEYLENGLITLEDAYLENKKLHMGEMQQVTMVTPSGIQLDTILSNPTNKDMDIKNVCVSGISMQFNTNLEEVSDTIKIYPSKTNATQKFLFPAISVEDAEIVLGLGEYSKLVHTETLNNDEIIHQVSYGDEDISATVIGQYGMNSGLSNIYINFEKLNSTMEDAPPEPQPGPAPMPVE